MKRIAIVIPTKNEAKTIKSVVSNIRSEIKNLGHELVAFFITDDSNDKTREIAESIDVRVINGGGRGLGEAMFRGLKQASKENVDYILTVDADGQANTKEVSALLKPLEENTADLVLSSRFKNKESIKYRYPLLNSMGIRILVWFLRKGTKLPITDSHGGLRGMRRAVASELEMLGVHTYVQETIFDAHQKGFRITEIPGEWHARNGKSRVLASIPKYIAYTLPVILLRLGYHMTVLLPAFGAFFLVGIALLIPSLINPQEAFAATSIGSLLLVTGLFGMFTMLLFEYVVTAHRRTKIYN